MNLGSAHIYIWEGWGETEGPILSREFKEGLTESVTFVQLEGGEVGTLGESTDRSLEVKKQHV